MQTNAGVRLTSNHRGSVSILGIDCVRTKFIHRAHFTPERLSCIKTGSSPLHPRCKLEIGMPVHMVRSCSKLRWWWMGIENILGKVLLRNINTCDSFVPTGKNERCVTSVSGLIVADSFIQNLKNGWSW